MKKIIIFLFVFIVFVFSKEVPPLSSAFQKGFYSRICMNRWFYINKYVNKREDLLSIVAYACLKKRYLTPALDLAKVLKKTALGRKNATYITTLFLMKKLILQYIFDDIHIRNIKLPIIKDDLLGKIFSNIQEGNFLKEKNSIVIKENNKKFIVYPNKNYNIVIKVFVNNKLTKKVIYW
ncbi:conserved hypothetical protein [Lebetimonas natsushimae]|uniref:Uncharacterized protein n=1 Tax=Lebetimonas natsushimae TaxID=1936991 RepID=A0A292YDQ5_9BACT|nr:hypothetical protein [Lebetimonas natsushimae]GAX87385.1 conserved hypothetical protein [Lebetimonas natsushimae]